jgi:hypothetical protein
MHACGVAPELQEPAQYCSQSTAISLAVAAYRRAAQLTGCGERILGVAATCALATVCAYESDGHTLSGFKSDVKTADVDVDLPYACADTQR